MPTDSVVARHEPSSQPNRRSSEAAGIHPRNRALIRHSKTDQQEQRQEVAISRGYRLRPVEAMQTWPAAAEINDGPVFRPMTDSRV
jgi:hypothetical protein